jgi:hypothetical protein
VVNERIKLPAQEWLGYDPEKGDLHGYTVEQMREFAELIIQECVGVVEGGRFLHTQAPTAIFAKECSDAIKRHFGVSE